MGGMTLKHVRLIVRLQIIFISSFKFLIVFKCFEVSQSNVILYFENVTLLSLFLCVLIIPFLSNRLILRAYTVILFIFQVTEYLYANKMAFRYPEPEDKAKYIRERIWRSEYDSLLPDVYDWPESALSPPLITE